MSARRCVCAGLVAAAGVAPAAAVPEVTPGAASSEVIVVRSGNGPVGGLDGEITHLDGSERCPLRPAPFTAADFAAACAGPPAKVVANHPSWIATLPGDPAAQWIAVDRARTPVSLLYCQEFEVTSTDIVCASIRVYYAADDTLGDPPIGPSMSTCPVGGDPGSNRVGIYLNGTAIVAGPDWPGGIFDDETEVFAGDVTAEVRTGTNTLHVYQRDTAGITAGSIYSATIRIEPEPCKVPMLPQVYLAALAVLTLAAGAHGAASRLVRGRRPG